MAFATCVATAFEQRRPLPVDAMVPDPLFTSTHAIAIDAAPDQVWPWIVQMGAGRAGWYSWDAIDNGGTPSARRVVPELQTVIPGDVMPAVRGATDAFLVAAVDPPRDLVLTVPDGHGGHAVAWEHVLEPIDGGRTRLVVRGRASAHWLDLARAQPPAGHHRIFIERAYAVLAHLPRPLLIGVATFGHRVMEARHLRGIQRRSTASGRHRGSAAGVTDGFTLLTFEPERILVLGWTAPEGGYVMTWAFVLEETEHGSTRLSVRVRVRPGARICGLPWWAANCLVSVIHFVMQRKQLIGIARRAELTMSRSSAFKMADRQAACAR